MTTWYRVHKADKVDQLLANPTSRPWETGAMMVACRDCGTQQPFVGNSEACTDCGATNQFDERDGISVCRHLVDLIYYFEDRNPDMQGCVVVEVEGEPTSHYDHDHGRPGDPVLIHPTRIVSVNELDEGLLELDEEMA